MKFLAYIQEMADSEILNYVPARVHEEIKKTDPHPTYRAYVIGQEGEAVVRDIQRGDVVRHWFRSAIQMLSEKLAIGTKVFHNHAESNKQAGRNAIGRIVGRALDYMQNKLTAIAIMYIDPEFRKLPLNIASIEATMNLKNNEEGIQDIDVGEITGVALGNSKLNSPGFASATLLAEVQAMFEKSSRIQANKKKGDDNMADEITIGDVRSFIKAEKVKPSDLFGVEILSDDPMVKGLVTETAKEKVAGEYSHRKRHEEEFDKQKKDWDDERKKLADKIKELEINGAKLQVKDFFAVEKEVRKLTEKQAKFIEKRLTGFAPIDPTKTKEEFAKFLDAKVDEYKDITKDLGIEEKVDDKKSTPGGESDKKDRIAGDVDDRLNPETNPFIPKI